MTINNKTHTIMKKELYLPPELRVKELSLFNGILSVVSGSGTLDDFVYEDLGTE